MQRSHMTVNRKVLWRVVLRAFARRWTWRDATACSPSCCDVHQLLTSAWQWATGLKEHLVSLFLSLVLQINPKFGNIVEIKKASWEYKIYHWLPQFSCIFAKIHYINVISILTALLHTNHHTITIKLSIFDTQEIEFL